MAASTRMDLGGRGEVLVGVDGSAAAEAAVRYAAREADRLGLGLRLLHVIPALALGTLPQGVDPLDLAEIEPRLRQRRDRVLGRAGKLARDAFANEHVHLDLVIGERIATLLDAAERARLVVLGAPWHPRVDRLITGSVVGAVASKSPVPVFGVPEDWRVDNEHAHVVVAVKSPEDPASQHLVAQALEIAAARKSRLTVLHAWEFPVVYDDMIATQVEEEAWNQVKRGSLEELIALARGPHVEVEVDFRIVHGQGSHAIVHASTHADLVVIARRRHGFPFGHLGSAGRAVLRESRCPVEVVPPTPVPEAELAEGSPAASEGSAS